MRISSPYDGHGRAGLRATLAAVLAFDTLLVSHFLASAHPGPASHPHAPAWLLAFAGRTWAIAPVATVAIAALVAFARRPAALLPGWIALACVGLLVEAHAACIEGPYRIFFSGGAAMLGWLVGASFSERHAELGAAAGLAATYVNAIASKVTAGGIGWTGADSLRAVVLTQHHVGGSWLSNAYASAVAGHGWLAGTLVTLTLVAQASALAYPWHRTTRAISGALLLAFHANTAILTPLFFPQAMVLLLAFSFPWPAVAARLMRKTTTHAAHEHAPALRATRKARLVLVATAVAGGLVAWTSPLRSYTLAHHRHPPDALPPAFADLHRGAQLDSWTVRSASTTPGGTRLVLVNGPLVLRVLVVPIGSMQVLPPATTQRYDVLYETGAPDEPTVTGDAAVAVVQLVATAIRARE